MIRRLSTEPQIPEVQSHEVEHIERERTIPQHETSHEPENLEDQLKDEMSGPELKKALGLLSPHQDLER